MTGKGAPPRPETAAASTRPAAETAPRKTAPGKAAPGKTPAAETAAPETTAAETLTPAGERIAKRLARAGLCSRREAERWVRAGRVAVDGETLHDPAVNVTPASRIAVDGSPLPEAERPRLWRYHKPAGLLCTARDPEGRPTIFDRLPKDLPRVITVGRLDLASEGLILLTNDGEIARHLELPATGWVRRYRVRVFGTVDAERLAALSQGVTVDGITYGPIEAALERRTGANAWLSMSLAEGRNREVRRVLTHLGLRVNRLIRLSFGPFQLGQMRPGAVAEVHQMVIREQLGDAFMTSGQGGPGARQTQPGKSRAGWAQAKKKVRPKRRPKQQPKQQPKRG